MEKFNETIKLLCSEIKITIKKGLPYQPPSQGQVEA